MQYVFHNAFNVLKCVTVLKMTKWRKKPLIFICGLIWWHLWFAQPMGNDRWALQLNYRICGYVVVIANLTIPADVPGHMAGIENIHLIHAQLGHCQS